MSDRKFTDDEQKRGRETPVFASMAEKRRYDMSMEKKAEKETKYPGADTSRERYLRIENNYAYWRDDIPKRAENPPPREYYVHMLRDLLAMIEERDAAIAELSDEIAIEGGIRGKE